MSFHDLTMIFADVGEPVYADNCCHLNPRGDQIMGRTIGQAIIQSLTHPVLLPVKNPEACLLVSGSSRG